MNTSSIKFLNLAIVCLLIFSSCGTKNSSSAGSSSSDKSTATGWEYNNYKNGGFEQVDKTEQETGPGLVLVEGGVFTMGSNEEDVMKDNNAGRKKTTVATFYMDETEVTNQHWLEYMYWMQRVYNKSYPHVYKKCLPDTLAWRKTLGYREKYVNYYLRHPSYRDYPVVGVSWLQANEFCKWRTDRVNEAILVREGIIQWHFADVYNNDVGAGNNVSYSDNIQSKPENMFSTENYLNGNYTIKDKGVKQDNLNANNEKNPKYLSKNGKYIYEKDQKYDYNVAKESSQSAVTRPSAGTRPPAGKRKKAGKRPPAGTRPPAGSGQAGNIEIPRDPYQLTNYDPLYADLKKGEVICLGKRALKMEDGIILPNYRLPTEAEWEFAALGLIGNLDPDNMTDENIINRNLYPWNGHYVREDGKWAGAIQANFMRGKGDMMGMAGNHNDGADITTSVKEFLPNDYGLYHMAGNVSEWVMDVYRPRSSDNTDEFMPFRGNVYTTQLLKPNGLYDKPVKANENLYDVHGMKEFVNEFARVMYLATTKNALDLDKKFSTNYNKPKASKIDFSYEESGDTVILKFDPAQLIDLNKSSNSTNPIKWDLTKIDGAIEDKKSRLDKIDGDTIIKLITTTPSVYTVTLKLGTTELTKEIDTKGSLVNSTISRVKINSRQEKDKYKYNSPSLNFISSKGFTKNDSIQFAVLDDIIAILDTAIYLQNKGNETKASHYIEVALFGSYSKAINNILTVNDFREIQVDLKNNSVPFLGSAKIIVVGGNPDTIAKPIFGKGSKFNKEEADHYLAYRFNNYDQDPNITTWILTLRNGLTEFVTETKGKQRWRNVTVEENAGRLNYRKDDYRDQFDGDLESSIYYNDASKLNDIDNGKRDPKQVMYQSDFETYDLEGNLINTNGNPKTLISDKSRVYKGGSWADRTYWMGSGTRRFLDEDKTSDMIGFRCAMDRVGSSSPNSRSRNRR
jgi:formylglycine-generating enzyme required for sulfatase activity